MKNEKKNINQIFFFFVLEDLKLLTKTTRHDI
jgi:hypothetical protein